MDVVELYAHEIESLLKIVEEGAECPYNNVRDIVASTGYRLEDLCTLRTTQTPESRWNEGGKKEKLNMLIDIVYGLLLRLSGGDPLTGEDIGPGQLSQSQFVFDHLVGTAQKGGGIKKIYVKKARGAADDGTHSGVLEWLIELVAEVVKTRACHNGTNVRGPISHASARLQVITDRLQCMHGYYRDYGTLSDSE